MKHDGHGARPVMSTTRVVVLGFAFVILLGALLLTLPISSSTGVSVGFFDALFTSTSCVCVTGLVVVDTGTAFSTFGHVVIILLIQIGGLGFAVLQDIKHNRSFRKLRLHSKLVITFTAILLFGGTLIVLLVEWSNPATLGPMNFFQKLQAAFFQSVTLRTAGFNTIDQASLLPATKMISVILMFIGASPASTGGGVKTSTMAVLCLNVRMVARGRSEIAAYHRTINRDTMQRALAIVMIGLAVLLIDIMALTLLEPQANFLDLAFECASALGTVGVSSVGTGTLEPVSRMLLILAMYIGRVGPLTLTMALGHKQAQTKDAFRYPEERVLVG